MTAGSVSVPTIVPLRAPQPGQHKSIIDTNTKIELRTETAGATIYYTTNGSNPEPFQKHGIAAKATTKYTQPFRLSGGKRCVKAIAVSIDGVRDSNVVSKTFDVEQLPEDEQYHEDDGTRFIRDIPYADRAKRDVSKYGMVSSKQAWTEIQEMRRKDELMKQLNIGTDAADMSTYGTRFTNSRLGNDRSGYGTMATGRTENGQHSIANNTGLLIDTDYGRPRVPETATHAMRMQREDDFLRCIYCRALRPADPYARFCGQCGNAVPPLPQTRIAPPEAGQVGTCVHCKSQVPFNTDKCVICEADMPSQNQPMASVKLANKILCTACGTGNPVTMTYCVTCEAALPLSSFALMRSLETRRDDVIGGGRLGVTQNDINGTTAQWTSMKAPVPKYDVSTQTVGLVYPSAKSMVQARDKEEAQLAHQQSMSDRKPVLTAISPGKGYWRKQIDHINMHIKAHAQNNAEFRSLIAEPRMGKVLSTAVHEDGYELCMTVTFALRGNKDPFAGEKMGYSKRDFLSNYIKRGGGGGGSGSGRGSIVSYGSQDSLVSGRSSARSTKSRGKRSARRSRKNKLPPSRKISEQDRMLLKEVNKSGNGSPSEIEHWVEEGADPNVKNKDDYPVLFVATMNKHHDAIPILVQHGADINAKGPNKGSTALHEAVIVGSTARDVIGALLGCGAKTSIKNDKGQTPYDLALDLGQESLAKMLSAKLGQSALSKLTKPKSSSHTDIF